MAKIIPQSCESEELTAFIRSRLISRGADLIGIGDLRKLPSEVRANLPVGIAVAIRLPKDIAKSLEGLPTAQYYEQYVSINKKLDALVEYGAEILEKQGYRAIAQTKAYVGKAQTDYQTRLPHKTVATRAGLGWIGKCALLVTEPFGSAVRISSILTDAPLVAAEPIDQSRCGVCAICKDACPGEAVLGKNWHAGADRDEYFDARACRETARRRSWKSLQMEISLCGRCIAACPYTQRYCKKKGERNVRFHTHFYED